MLPVVKLTLGSTYARFSNFSVENVNFVLGLGSKRVEWAEGNTPVFHRLPDLW